MKLVGKKILVEPLKTKDVTSGGIALPEQSRQTLPMGPVKQVGPEVEGVEPGEVVMFSSIGAMPVQVGKGEYILIEPEDILMILEEGEYDEA